MNKEADLILTGGQFFPGKGLDDQIEFIAIKENKILKLGLKDDMYQYIGEGTKIIQLEKDDFVMPGFVDAHLHIVMAGMMQKYVDLGAATSEDEAARMVRDFAETIPDDDWILGFNWYNASWENSIASTLESLDRYILNRPVCLIHASGHGGWVNSKALELLGIDSNTEDPKYGKISRFEDGSPSGYLYESALVYAIKIAFDMPVENEKVFIKEYMKEANSFGITSSADMEPFYGSILGKYQSYHELDKTNELTVRIHAAPHLLGNIDEVTQAALKFNTDMYRINMLKEFMDGVPSTFTALMVDPYKDDLTTCGAPLSDLNEIYNKVDEAHEKGFSVRLHACGDKAVRNSLDAIESAIKKHGKKDLRHTVEHVEIIHPDDFLRFKELGVCACIQPAHLAMTKKSEANQLSKKFTDKQLELCFAINSLMKSGCIVAFGSDCPVASINPFVGIYRAVTRLHDDGKVEGIITPSEKINIEDALHAYTYNGAYCIGRENELGTLEEGKLADIAVLDKNLLSINPEEIRNTSAVLTIMNGKIVYLKKGRKI